MTETSPGRGTLSAVAEHDEIAWMSTQEAARRLGVTTRTLYRFVDEGLLPAYKMGRVFRLQAKDVDDFIERSRVQPGTLEHLYPERKTARTDPSET
jgi:excisionase family DNA binding protein